MLELVLVESIRSVKVSTLQLDELCPEGLVCYHLTDVLIIQRQNFLPDILYHLVA
jgi:hypothetical protein